MAFSCKEAAILVSALVANTFLHLLFSFLIAKKTQAAIERQLSTLNDKQAEIDRHLDLLKRQQNRKDGRILNRIVTYHRELGVQHKDLMDQMGGL